MIAIQLPFPHKVLWPNGRGHWSVKAREVKKHRQWAYAATRAANLPTPEGRVDLVVTIHPKTRHPIDRDNAIASLKSYLDGIAQALGVDDQTFNTPFLTFGEPVKGGRVLIVVVG